jgi:SAM-dependent methyltransferase
MHTNSKLLFSKFAVPFFRPGQRVLEIGPDSFPSTYRKLVPMDGLIWETLDIYDSPSLTYPSSSPYSFAIPDDSFDVVVSGQVLEHIPKMWTWLAEVCRVVKKGGIVITIVPTSWPYHVGPNFPDCWRIFPEGIKALCEDVGLLVEQVFWGSLELPECSSPVQGRSQECQPRKQRIASRWFRRVGVPVEKAFDTICIAKRPA